MNKRNNCKYYDGCNAQLCPMLSDEDNNNYIWYPDEDICRRKKNIPDWIRQQRKVAKKANPDNFWFYFTIDMLKVRFRVTNSVKGIDPNKEDSPQLKQWFKRNKGTKKRKISNEQRKQRREQLAKAREIKKQQNIQLSNNTGLAA
jgi:hypothetical protein